MDEDITQRLIAHLMQTHTRRSVSAMPDTAVVTQVSKASERYGLDVGQTEKLMVFEIQSHFTFPFQRLPGELRNMTYECIIDDVEANTSTKTRKQALTYIMTHPLLRLNSLVRNEFLSTIYKRATLEVWGTNGALRLLQLHPQVSQTHLRKIVLECLRHETSAHYDSMFQMLAQCDNLREIDVWYDFESAYATHVIDDWESPSLQQALTPRLPMINGMTKLRGLEKINLMQMRERTRWICRRPLNVLTKSEVQYRMRQIMKCLKPCLRSKNRQIKEERMVKKEKVINKGKMVKKERILLSATGSEEKWTLCRVQASRPDS